jgi:hypothetical protein
MVKQMFYVAPCAGKEIIDTDDNCPLRQQAFAKVRSEKAGPTRDRDAFLKVHEGSISWLVSDLRPYRGGGRKAPART